MRRQSEDRLPVIAASMAFWVVIGLLPGLIAALMLLSLVLDPAELAQTVEAMRQESPDSVSTLILDQVRVAVSNRPASFSLTFVLAILALVWTASSAYMNFSRGTRLAYRLEPHRLVPGRVRAVGGALVAVAVCAVLAGVFGLSVRAISGWEGPSRVGAQVLGILIDFLIVIGLLMALMRMATGRQTPPLAYLPGAILATIAITVIVVVYGAYMVQSESYQSVYGALAGIIVLMLLLYLCCWMTLLGAAINAEWRGATAGAEPASEP